MAMYLVDGQDLTAIGDALRSKTNETAPILVTQMPGKILQLGAGGGDIAVPFMYGGTNGQLLNHYQYTATLADTSYVIGKTDYPTSATKILDEGAIAAIPLAINFNNNDYVIIQQITLVPNYGAAQPKPRIVKNLIKSIGYVYRRKASVTSTGGNNSFLNLVSVYQSRSKNTSGTQTYTSGSAQYGIYPLLSTPSLASASTVSTTLTIKSPTLNARSNSTYCSAAALAATTDCAIAWTVDVFTVDPGSLPMKKVFEDAFIEAATL